MTVLIAIPVFRVSCKVAIDKGRAWSVVDELLLWAITRQSKTIAALAVESRLPRQIVVASIARLMRFRLVEVELVEGGAAFRASEYGFSAITGGKPLPFFPKRQSKRVSFVIEWASGDFFPRRDINLMSQFKLDQERANGAEVRPITVDGGGPSMSHEANLRRLSDIAARGWDEEIALIDGRTAVLRDDEFMVIRVIDGIPRGLPERAGPSLRSLVAHAVGLPPGSGDVAVGYSGPREELDGEPISRSCVFDPADLIIGGSEQRDSFLGLLGKAHRRVIIHSTFLDAARFEVLLDPIRAACRRGVTFDLLWGGEADEDTEKRNSKAAIEIARLVRQDRDTNGRFRVHMRSTGSHAKLVMLDSEEGWIAAVGSCNWLSSPFQAVELSVVLRDNLIVADVAVAMQRLVGRRGLADTIATEMALTARDLRRLGSEGGPAEIAVVVGEAHDRLIRAASGSVEQRLFVGSHRLGSTARPGALMQGEFAARQGVEVTVLYTQASGPLKNRHVRALAAEAAANGVRLVKTRKIPLHGKVVAWDDDNLVVTSLNWASASADADFPWNDIGLHVRASGVGLAAVTRLWGIFPELRDDAADAGALTAAEA